MSHQGQHRPRCVQMALQATVVCWAFLLPASTAFHVKRAIVAHDVAPGHVVATLPYWGQTFSLDQSHSSARDMSPYFAILSTGDLVTTSNISSLLGNKISLVVRSQLGSEHWQDTVHVDVKHRDKIVTFSQQRYEGNIMENVPVGTTVDGLQDLVATTSTNKLLHYSIVSGAMGQFQVVQPFGSGPVELLTKQVLDHEKVEKWYLELEATSEDPTDEPVYAKVRVAVRDQNDNEPKFGKDFYQVTIKDSTPVDTTILHVTASDPDEGIIRYTMYPHDNFRVNPYTGAIVLKSKFTLLPKTYVIQVYAEDNFDRKSKPTNIQIDVNGNLYYEPHAGRHHHDRRTRWKRDTLTVKEVEVMESIFGKIVDLPNNGHERFAFRSPAPEMLEINAVTGTIGLRQDKHLDYETQPEIEFSVLITRNDNPSYERIQPVRIRLIDVNDEIPQFINLPRPFLATVSPNAGPANFAYQLIAQDDDKNSVLQFNLESGGEDRFEVDPETGVVRTRGKTPFRLGKEYEIGVSVEDIMAPSLQKSMTYSLKILVGERNPQFYETQYKATVPETAPDGFEIIQVQAKSHQDYPISFELATESESQSNEFAINSETGVVDLLRPLDYEKEPAQYHLRAMAIENGRPQRTSTVSLIIDLVDMNDNVPTFPLSQYIVRGIAETVQIGDDILQVTATDVDSVTNSQLTYSVSDGNFTVQTFNNIGYIRTHRRLDYDGISDHTYNFTVTATDNGSPPHSGTAMIRVSVSNVNDEDPQFMQPIEHVQVSEDADPNTVVHVVQAYDPDGDTVSYSFTGKHLLEGPFSINPQSGIITLIGPMDKSVVSYRLNITAKDDGSCCGSTTSRSNTGLVIIEIKDINNNAPRFPDCGTYRPEVDEKKNVGTQVIRVVAVDPDTGGNGNVTYSIVKSSDQSSDNFFIEPNSGILRTADMFDREGQIGVTDFGVTIKAEDQGSPKLAGFCTFRVKIGDKNDNPPVFNLPVYTTSIEENSIVGKKLKQVYAMDRDAGINGDVEYFIRSDPSGFFTIDQHSGWVSVARPMTGRDFVQLEIEARDRGEPAKSSTVKMDVEITQTMNAYPQWIEDYSSRTVIMSENVPVNHIVTRLTATSSMPNSDVNYFIQHGETPEQNGPPRSFYHRIDERTNEMVLMTYRTLDFESIPKYILTIKAANRAANSLHNDTRLLIELRDENDEIPQFIGMDENGRYPGSVAENLDPGADVITVTATDRDEFERFRKITYKIKEKDTDYQYFTIDHQTGLIRTTRMFDREKKSDYYITVVAEDGAPSDRPNHEPPGTPNQGEAEVQIRITDKNDNYPFFKKMAYYAEVAENADIGALVLLVTAEDQDEGNALSYSISGGNIGNAFEVHPTQGEIRVRGSLDYDLGIREYELTFRVFDDKFANNTKVYIKVLDVNDNPPRFDHSIYNVTDINEEEAGISRNNPKYLLTVRATDPDTERESNLKYSLTGQFADDGTFMINEYTGEIYLTRKLDRDKPWGRPIWNFNILAHDEIGSGHSLTGYAEVRVMPRDINDNAPEFDRSRLKGSIPENSDGGRPVLTVIADDKDHGSNGTVSYSLRQVHMHDTTPLFSIESNSGLITTTIKDSLDRETQEDYKIIVVAKDRGPDPKSSTATVTIVVTDINDHVPKFTQEVYHTTMTENYAIGQSITSVSATDLDIGSNAALTYSLKESDREFFGITTVQATNTGVLKIFKAVDYDALLMPVFNLTVYVNDPIQDGSHRDSALIEVRVTDFNDNPPTFQPPTHQVRVFENVKVGTTLARFRATDRDTGDNKKFHYAIDTTTDPLRQFSIDSNGLVTTAKMLDRETEQTHRVYILAIDHGVPSQTGVGTLIVNLMDINDNYPTFARDYRPVIYENEPPGRTVAIISATDKDTATNGPPFEMWLPCGGGCPCRDNPVCGLFDFKFEAGRGEMGFGSGTIRSLKTFDREERKEYYLPIIMRDSGEPAMSGTNTLTIIIGDKNDNKHYPGKKNIFVYNYKGMFDDAVLGNVYAEDEDDWDVVNKTFHFVNKDWAKMFRLDELSGELRMNGRIREGSYTFEVRVYDVVHQREVVSQVTVTFKDISDDAVFNSGSIRLSGVTAEEFVTRPPSSDPNVKYGKSRYDLLRQHIAKKLRVVTQNVDIFTIINHPTLPRTIDIRYSAHGSPYYKPVKLDGIISDSTHELEDMLGVQIMMTPIDECLKERCESGGCSNILNITGDPLLINTNGTSLIGITAFVQASCICAARTFDTDDDVKCRPDSCLNGGTCTQRKSDFVCSCRFGFDGPRCQMTRHSFNGDGWAWYKPLAQCEHSHTSLEFITTSENGIIMYNGPLHSLEHDTDQDFILLELRSGYPYLQIDQGTGKAKLTVDGRDTKNENKLRKLNDGKWHRIDIYRDAKIVKMVIDSCGAAVINENENAQTSSEDRRPCEAISETPGENKYVNVNTPLQLGGIADMKADFIKKHLQSGSRGFIGCMKNFVHNGELYDLYMGKSGQHLNTQDGCPTEDVVCGVNDIEGLRCGYNGTCIGSFLQGEYSCDCKPGWRGPRCSIPTTTKDFRKKSFIEWDFKDMFYAEQQNQLHRTRIQMMIRTRQESGLLFKAQNIQKSEYIRLELVKSRLRFRYNLGSGENHVLLSHVVASDGQWHTVQVDRTGQWVTLKVDGGEGRFYNESLGNSLDHRDIRISQMGVFAGGDVRFPSSNSPPMVDYDYLDSCMNDIRYNGEWFPMDHSQNPESRAADLTRSDHLEPGCISDVCPGKNDCRAPLICYDLWRKYECGCPLGQELVGPPDTCININECESNPCHNGRCVDNEYGFTCTCEPGYAGELCASPQHANIAYFNTGFILAIVICALVLLLLIVIFIVYTRRRRPESYTVGVDPDDDVRENIIHYDEEGVGEEDQDAYDISKLKKPLDDSLKKQPLITIPPPVKEKPRKRIPYKPGETPDVGNFITDRLDEADQDPNAPPHDSVREYAYEGTGSVAGSLSSLASTSDIADQNYDYLNDWGPRFTKLADMYGETAPGHS